MPRPPDIVTETAAFIRFQDREDASMQFCAEVNRGQRAFANEHAEEFLAVTSEDPEDMWFMTRDEATRFHAWLGRALRGE